MGHALFALVHGVHHMQLGATRVRMLFVNQRLGYEANDPPSRTQGGVRHDAHEPAASTTKHQLALVFTNPLTHRFGRLHKRGVTTNA